MTTLETVRLVGEIVGILVVAGGGGWWMTKLLWRIYNQTTGMRDEVTATNVKLDVLNVAVVQHTMRLDGHDKSIAYLEGKESVRAEIAVAVAAAAASEIVTKAAEAAKQLLRDTEREKQ